MTDHFSDFLFAQPSFWEGAARVVDLGGTLDRYNSSSSEEEADDRALRADVAAIGHDLRQAMRQFATDHQLPVNHDPR